MRQLLQGAAFSVAQGKKPTQIPNATFFLVKDYIL